MGNNNILRLKKWLHKQAANKKLKQVCRDTGIDYDWIQKFKNTHMYEGEDDGPKRIDRLLKYSGIEK